MTRARLLLFAGMPGVGKTTLARTLAAQIGAVYLRIDSIEDGLRRSHIDITDLKDAGYTVAQAVAADALMAGQTVVADAVHDHRQGWDDWETVAREASVEIAWFRIVCSDEAEHRSRIERRALEGAVRGADWSEITSREFDPWPKHWSIIDTAGRGVEPCIKEILELLDRLMGNPSKPKIS